MKITALEFEIIIVLIFFIVIFYNQLFIIKFHYNENQEEKRRKISFSFSCMKNQFEIIIIKKIFFNYLISNQINSLYIICLQ